MISLMRVITSGELMHKVSRYVHIDANTDYTCRCMPHIYNLAVNDVLSGLSDHAAYTDEALAVDAVDSMVAADLVDPVLTVRGFVAAVRS